MQECWEPWNGKAHPIAAPVEILERKPSLTYMVQALLCGTHTRASHWIESAFHCLILNNPKSLMAWNGSLYSNASLSHIAVVQLKSFDGANFERGSQLLWSIQTLL
jgi:hypothetical protein